MNIQRINFKSTYIFPDIKSKKTEREHETIFVSTVLNLADKKKRNHCVYKKTGLEMKIIDKYDAAMERIAYFCGIKFIKK